MHNRGRALLAVAAAWAAACGPTAQLSALRCDGKCQDTADPFLLRLQADFDDPASILGDAELVLKVNGGEVARYRLAPLLPAGATSGTLKFQLKLSLPTIEDGQQFMVRARAVEGGSDASNEVALPMVVAL